MAAAMNTTIVAGDFARAWALETPVKPFNMESYAIGLEKLVQTSLAKLQTQFEASSALNVDELRAKANQRALEKEAVLERTKLEKTKAVGLTPLSDRALQQAEDWSASFNLTALGTSIAPSGSAVGPTPTGGEETKAVSSSGPLKDWDAISTISKSLGGGASGVPVGPPPTSGESEIKPRAEVLSASRVKEPDSLKKQPQLSLQH